MKPLDTIVADRKMLARVFFFGVFAYLLYQLALIFSPFFGTLLAAATLVIVFHPIHTWILKLVRGRDALAAAISTAFLLLVVIVPFLLLAWLVIREAAGLLPTIQEWLRAAKDAEGGGLLALLPDSVRQFVERMQTLVGDWGLEPEALLATVLENMGEQVSAGVATLLKNMFVVVINLLIIVFGAFFFFRDGTRMVRFVVDLVPMQQVHKDLVVSRLDRTLSAVVRGVIVTATVQGFLAGIGFAFAGVDRALLLGFLCGLFAFIPIVGTALIWVPVAVQTISSGRVGWGIFLVVWGVAVVSAIDNVLKPLLIGERAQLPIFLLFFGILGGLKVYGPVGALVGPLLVSTALSFIRIYRETFVAAAAEPSAAPPPAQDAAPPAAG
jgi:predicted PurR-regulated permease PerM